MAEAAPAKGIKDLNIYSRKFLLAVAAVLFLGYGMHTGSLVWKDGANYIVWVVCFYCASEGYADGTGRGVENVVKTAVQIAAAAGAASLPALVPPTPPEAPKTGGVPS